MRWFDTRRLPCRLLLLVALPSTLWLSAAAVGGEPPTLPALSGHWKKSVSPQQDARRTKSIEDATADLNFIVRGIAQGRLEKRSTASDELHIQVARGQLSIRAKGKHWELPLNGKPQRVANGDEEGTVGATVDRGKAVIIANGENGRRTTTFTPSDDGKTLLWTVTIVSERLSKPIEASVTYRRVNPAGDAAPNSTAPGPSK